MVPEKSSNPILLSFETLYQYYLSITKSINISYIQIYAYLHLHLHNHLRWESRQPKSLPCTNPFGYRSPKLKTTIYYNAIL